MNKLLSCAIGAIACAASVEILAQAPVAPQPPSPNVRQYVVLGCVSRETPPTGGSAPAPFLITDDRGDKPVVYRLDGDVTELTFHVGHTVEVSGPLTAPPASASGPNATALVLKVRTLAYLATTCKPLKP